MDEVDVLVVVAGLEVVVAGLDAVVVVVEVAGLVTAFGGAAGLCAKTTEAVAQSAAKVLSKFIGLMMADLVETAWCASSLGLGITRRFYLFSKASKRRRD
jgi:uncharacterized protein (DUF697 family)